jgi:16S rRNA processing protein RimM
VRNRRKQEAQHRQQSKPPEPLVIMGRVAGPYGVLGWIRIIPYTEHVDGLGNYATWWLGRENASWREVKVKECAAHGNTLIALLEQHNDRNEAAALKGLDIAVPRSQLPVLAEKGDEGYYWSDLIGLEVINLSGELLGKVTGLIETGANDVLQVQDLEESSRERLIPFIEPVIVKVDQTASRITVDWGLDY